MRHFFKTSYILLLSILCGATAIAETTVIDTVPLIAPGDTLQLVSRQFTFTEGPAVDAQGSIFFTDQPNNAIWQWHTNGTLHLFRKKSGRANGMYIDKQGNLYACADEKNEVWRITPPGKKTVLYKAPKRRRLNGPNDIWVDATGGCYITDPYYQRPYWKRKKPALPGQYVYYLPGGSKKLILVDSTLKQPNGIVGTPDGKQLYVVDIGAGKIYKYDIASAGIVTNKMLFTDQTADGITLDVQGNLYAAGDGVTIFNPAGQQIGHIAVPEKWTSNVCFGGAAKNQLFITASEGVYIQRMLVNGVE